MTPARPDLAAKHLEGKIKAQRYAVGDIFEISDALTPLRREPSSDSELQTEALRGERATIYERTGEGWAWGQLSGDGYVGWLPDRALKKPGPAPTHKIVALRTFAFPGPSIKLPPVDMLSMGAALTVIREEGAFGVTSDGWYVPKRHVGAIDHVEADFVAVAEKFLGTPYLWGGKSSLGIDCSGLVQIALNAAGIGCLRDSDMQQKCLGRELNAAESQQLQRGDLIFWKGHVAVVRDAQTIIHANAHHMATEIEKTKVALARIAASGSNVTAIKRLK
jgi:cell wall-associated NlpC family hydrolase